MLKNINKIYLNIIYVSAKIISKVPTNFARVLLYRIVHGYNIKSSSIGRGTVIIADKVFLDHCRLGKNNYFRGPFTIKIDSGANIGSNNRFESGWWTVENEQNKLKYSRFLHLGVNTHITSNHYFDVAGTFILGKASWVAGCGSQFWTHGAGVQKKNIIIGKNCYIGSAARFSPGTAIADDCIVAMGSIVTKEFGIKNAVIAGQPAKVIRTNYNWKLQNNVE